MNNIHRLFNYIYYSFFANETLILPHLWIGNYSTAHDKLFMMKNKITVVVNCTPDIPFITDTIGTGTGTTTAETNDFLTLPSISNIRIPVYDSHLEKDFLLMEQYLKLVIPILIQSFLKQENILVHCFAGKQRSGIVIASLLYSLAIHPDTSSLISKYIPKLTQCKSNKEKANCIFDYIVSKRPQTFNYGFRANFIKSFNRLYGIK
jgi:hypothetical protein